MSSFPEEKVPYIDSIGERHRNKQIIVQLPPYDSEARYCNGLTDEEKRELRIFVALRKRDAIDRGVVKQIPDVSEGYSCREVRNYFGSIRAFVVSDFQKLHVSELAKVDNGIFILFTCEWHAYLPMHTCLCIHVWYFLHDSPHGWNACPSQGTPQEFCPLPQKNPLVPIYSAG